MNSKINWTTVKEFEDITYKKSDGVARIAFNRPNVRNAFRPKTTAELYEAFYDAQMAYILFVVEEIKKSGVKKDMLGMRAIIG
jgi:1,4-dihydroxy-2-naphthoyl-CoA synthase